MLGAILGDIVGSAYENNNLKSKEFELFVENSTVTDDTIMTLAVAECIQNGYFNNKQKIVEIFKKWGRAYPNAGYGKLFAKWLFSKKTKPYGSFGNGAAMRISSVGWYAKSEEEVKFLSKIFTEVTHNHPDALKAAEVTAMCVYYARIGKSKDFIKAYVEKYYNIDFKYEELLENFVFDENCNNTIPQAIYCFLISTSFEDCIRTTISIGGDCDTTSAISCAIAEAYYKEIDKTLLKKILKYLPLSNDVCNPDYIIQRFIKFKKELKEN